MHKFGTFCMYPYTITPQNSFTSNSVSFPQSFLEAKLIIYIFKIKMLYSLYFLRTKGLDFFSGRKEKANKVFN